MHIIINYFTVNCGAGPQITEAIGNTTVALGREASLKCVVTHLLDYKVRMVTHYYPTMLTIFVKVAWVHIDRQMILTIGRHVITRIPRFNIIHDSHHTWTLTIRDVQAEDKGYYMCQVNTDPMISQTGHLDVVVPPTIIDDESSPSSVSVREKHNASLICKSAGVSYNLSCSNLSEHAGFELCQAQHSFSWLYSREIE